jgi:type II secretory pathway pseudopilin PulG
MKRAATIIELLTVIVLLAILAGLLLPVLSTALKSAKSTSCMSNERQLFVSIKLYQNDYDDCYPTAVSIVDTFGANNSGSSPELLASKLLTSYIKSPNVWMCPLDHGNPGRAQEPSSALLDCNNSCYRAFGESYNIPKCFGEIRSEAQLNALFESVSMTNPPLLFDVFGSWHGESDTENLRYQSITINGSSRKLYLMETNRVLSL